MSLQFIMGPSGAGKSHYLYEYVTNESLKHPEKNYIFLVPDQFKMQAERDLVMASPRKGLLNVEVLSFTRLAYRVFEETGENRRMILDDVGKNFVIRKIAGDNEEKLQILGKNLKKLGYISEIKSVISEFTQYDMKPETLDALLEDAEKNPNLYYKLKDIKLIYEEFREQLKERYITSEEIMDVLAMVAAKSEMLKDSVLILDGFTGFTPVQNKLLRELFHVCEKVLVSVTMDRNENPYVYNHPYQLFALSKQMVTTLVKIAKEENVEIEDAVSVYDRPVYRFKENAALDFLESHLFRYSKEHYEKEQDSVQIWCAKNPQEEVDFVAQKIRQLVRTRNYHYRDIAVLTNGMESYASQIEQIFSAYELPFFMDHKRSILLNSCVEYLRSLLAMAEQNFSYESVFRYLRTGLANLNSDEVDVLENYVIAMGIRGYRKWQEKWIRRTLYMEEAELAEINRIRELFMSSIEEIMAVLKSKKKTVLDVTKALHTFFIKEELQKQVKEYQLKFEKEGELALEKEYAQIYRIIIDLLDKFVELLGNEIITLKEYCELLDAGLEQAQVGIIPPSVDQIVIGDVQRSRIKDVKTVFLIGANDAYIPGNIKNQGLLSENDRNQITQTGTVLAPGVKEKTYIQKFYLYLSLTKPTNQVYLTYSKSDAGAEAVRPSYLVTDLLKLFTSLQVQEVPSQLKEKELTAKSGIKALVSGLQKRQEGIRVEWQELYSWYKRNPEWAHKVEEIVEAAFYQKPESRLSIETAKMLYGDVLNNSVSRLESFAACAYAHFLDYGLRLKEREEFEFGAVDLGTIFHNSIEKFSVKLEKSGYTWADLPNEKQEEFINESVEECIVDYGNSILYSTARNEYIIVRVKRMLRRTVWAIRKQLEKGDFVPSGYEVSFGRYEGLSTSNIKLGDLGKMRLLGKIDRIDTCEDEDKLYVKVIDYKTGAKDVDLEKLYYGLQLQLTVYMNAAVEMQQKEHPEKIVIPAGLFYYQIQDPIIERSKVKGDLDEALLKNLRPSGMVQASDEVVRHMDKEFTKDSLAIPVTRNANGSFSKYSKVLTEEEFEVISKHTKKQVLNAGVKILEGEAEIAPYELGAKTGCDYCPYSSICRFEEKVPGFEYRRLEEMDRETALEKMCKEVQVWE